MPVSTTDGWLPASWDPVTGTGKPYFDFRAYLGGGRDSVSGILDSADWGAGTANPYRCFIPRYPASYQFVINGAISFTDMFLQRTPPYYPNGSPEGGKYAMGHHDVITLSLIHI